MPETYHQLNAERSEARSLFQFGLKSILALTVVAMGLLLFTSLKPTAAEPTAGEAGGAHSGSHGAISITAFDLGFEPATLAVADAGDYEVTLVNTGSAPHDITLPDGQTIAAAAGETVTATLTIPEGGTTYLCSIPGHAAAGMTGTCQ